MRATEVLLQFSKLDGLHTKVFFMRLFVLKFDPFAKASFYLTFTFINSMDRKLALTQFYLRIGLAHTLTLIVESLTKTLTTID